MIMFGATFCKAQTVTLSKTDSVYVVVDKEPEFPGGPNDLTQFLLKNIHYPRAARESYKQGKVFVSFVVEKNGDVTNGKVLRPLAADLDAEALRLVSIFPKWQPGLLNGVPVRSQHAFAITFSLGDNNLPVDTASNNKPFLAIESAPEFRGGVNVLNAYILKNLNYKGSDHGTVKVKFVIDTDGKVVEPEILQGLSKDADKAALQLFKKMPAWKPGQQNSRAIRVQYIIPITF